MEESPASGLVTPGENADPLLPAETVAIVVHGVGDHSCVDIRAAARRGLILSGVDPARAAEVELEDFPRPRDVQRAGLRRGRQPALQVEAAGARHLLVPIVWSGFRLRAGRWSRQLYITSGLQVVMLALPVLAMIWLDLVRCVPRARGAWKLGVAAVSGAVLALLAGLVYGCWKLTVVLPFMFSGTGLASTPVPLAGLLGVGWLAYLGSDTLDLAGDVARYVADDEARTVAVDDLRAILLATAERAPRARILLIGHSLGSVLAARAAAGLPALAEDRLSLLTLGSPLRLMSKVFPRIVSSPPELVSGFEKNGAVAEWINLWRDQDAIGKDLRAGGGTFVEASLGAGPHWNYWSDERLWTAVSLVLFGASEATGGFAEAWKALPLDVDEAAELTRRWSRVSGAPALEFSLLAFLFFTGAATVFSPPWPEPYDRFLRWAIRLSWMGANGLLLLALLEAKRCLTPRASPREWLWELRAREPAGWLLIVLSAAVAATVYFLDQAVRGG